LTKSRNPGARRPIAENGKQAIEFDRPVKHDFGAGTQADSHLGLLDAGKATREGPTEGGYFQLISDLGRSGQDIL
jgi:hypothetical protein